MIKVNNNNYKDLQLINFEFEVFLTQKLANLKELSDNIYKSNMSINQ